jgi:hypothetical protein
MTRLAALAVAILGVLTACDVGSRSDSRDSGRSATTTAASALAVIEAPTPRFRVPRYDTSGVYPRVKDGTAHLEAVNAGLRAAVLADQRKFAPYARREKAHAPRGGIAYRFEGVYRTAINTKLVSASTVVVSALMPLTAEVFPGQPGGDRWLGMTIRVPSGMRVTVTDLFSDPEIGLRALAAAWKARISTTSAGPCVRVYSAAYTPTVAHYRAFALLPSGVAVGSAEVGACYRLVATVPYRVLRPYFSKLGAALVAGVRRPR